MKVLVTGGAGFIGSNVVRALLARGDDVRVLDNFSTGNRANLAGLDRDMELVEGELRSYERVHNAVRGVEVVFHLGALGSVPRSVQDPLTSSAVNVEGTLNVLLAARDEGVRRVVFASSSSIYGNQPELPLRESMAPDPISPYGVAKLAAERYCVSFARVYPFETVVLRYFNVFGLTPGPAFPVRGGGAALHHGDRRQTSRSRSSTTAGSRGTSPTWRTSSQRTCRLPTPRVSAAASSTSRAGRRQRSTSSRRRSAGCSTSPSSAGTCRRGRGPARLVGGRERGPEALGYEPTVSLEDGLRRTAEFLLGRKD